MATEQWENDFTRAVARNLATLREAQGLTIDAFARRCDEVVGVEGRFKPNTLQALFAGKRKGITATELFVFAEALTVPVLALLVPMVQDREMPLPGDRTASAQSMWQRVTGYGLTAERDEAKLVYHDLHEMAEFVAELNDLRGEITAFWYFDPSYEGMVRVLTPRGILLERVRGLLKSCRGRMQSFERSGVSFDRDDQLVVWCQVTRPEYLTEADLLTFAKMLTDAYRDEEGSAFYGEATNTDR